jgi:hypothetical protein
VSLLVQRFRQHLPNDRRQVKAEGIGDPKHRADRQETDDRAGKLQALTEHAVTFGGEADLRKLELEMCNGVSGARCPAQISFDQSFASTVIDQPRQGPSGDAQLRRDPTPPGRHGVRRMDGLLSSSRCGSTRRIAPLG